MKKETKLYFQLFYKELNKQKWDRPVLAIFPMKDKFVANLDESSCSGPRFFDSFHQFASGFLLPSAGGSKHVPRYETFRSSTSAAESSSSELLIPLLEPPTATASASKLPFFLWSWRKQAGAHSGTSGT